MHAQRLHLLDEVAQLAAGIADGRQFDLHVFLALRRMVQVQHALALAGLQRLRQRAGFTGLVAGYIGAVRGFVAALADDGGAVAIDALVGGIGSADAVGAVADDVRLGQAVEVGQHFMRQRVGGDG